MAGQQIRLKLLFCGLNLLLVFYMCSKTEANDSNDPLLRIFNSIPGFENITRIYCTKACGRDIMTKFAFASLLQKICQRKCPNSYIANLPQSSSNHSLTPALIVTGNTNVTSGVGTNVVGSNNNPITNPGMSTLSSNTSLPTLPTTPVVSNAVTTPVVSNAVTTPVVSDTVTTPATITTTVPTGG